MLMQAIRHRAQSWIGWVIVILIVIVMAAFGLSSYLEPDSDVAVAKVNGTDIKYRRFQNAYETERSRMMQQLRGVDPAILENLGLKETVLNRLIDEEVLFQKVLESGFAVGDVQLANYINQIQMFQREGRFDQETYERLLSASRLTAAEWEQGQRKVLMLRQPETVVVGSALVSNKSLEQLVKFQEEQRTFGYAVFSVADYMKDVEVSDDEALSYFEANKDDYMHPERVVVEYIELSLESLAKNVDVDEDAILQRYEDHKASFSIPERRRASHILIELDPEADEATAKAARDKAEEVVKKLADGEAFDVLASEYSDDPGSASQGGDLGFFERGIMDKAFETAAFALEEIGELSPIVQSAFGLHIIKLTGIEPSTTKPIDDVRETLEADYRESVAESQFSDLAEELDTLAFEHPDTLSVAAEQLGLEVKTSNFFSRNAGQGIGQYPKIRAAAFDEDVLENENNSALIEISNGHVAVVRKKLFEPKKHKNFEEVKAQIVSKLTRDKAAELTKQAAQAIGEQVQAGVEIEPLLEPLGVTWQVSERVKRDDSSIDRQLLTAVYADRHPVGDQPVYGEVELTGGDYAVYLLTVLIPGEITALSEQDLQALRERLATSRGRAEYVGLVNTWRDEAEIVTYPDRLE